MDIPPRCDQVMAALAALVDRVKNHNPAPNGKPTEGRWLAALDCFAEVAKEWLEPAIAAAGGLYFAVPHASVLVSAPATQGKKKYIYNSWLGGQWTEFRF